MGELSALKHIRFGKVHQSYSQNNRKNYMIQIQQTFIEKLLEASHCASAFS